MSLEYRVCWNASSNASFHGASDWEAWEDDGDPEDVLSNPEGQGLINLPPAMETALDCSGFDWYVETRETSA